MRHYVFDAESLANMWKVNAQSFGDVEVRDDNVRAGDRDLTSDQPNCSQDLSGRTGPVDDPTYRSE